MTSLHLGRSPISPISPCIGIARIDAAIGVRSRCSRHALSVTGELAVARIAPNAALKAVAVLCDGRRWGAEACHERKGGGSQEQSMYHGNLHFHIERPS
jgi:hypothetical protein